MFQGVFVANHPDDPALEKVEVFRKDSVKTAALCKFIGELTCMGKSETWKYS